MNKEEFIKSCISGGYANKKAANLYTERLNKDEYTIEDTIEIFRQIEHARMLTHDKPMDLRRSREMGMSHKSTKRYKQSYAFGNDQLKPD